MTLKTFLTFNQNDFEWHTNLCILDIIIITVIIANTSLCVFIWVLLPTIRGELAIVLSIQKETFKT